MPLSLCICFCYFILQHSMCLPLFLWVFVVVVVLFWLLNIFLFSVQTGPFVKLQMGCELSLYVDSECPTYCFNPCGHVASDGTVKYVC